MSTNAAVRQGDRKAVNRDPSARLPITRHLTLTILASALIAVILAATSVISIVYQTTIYPDSQRVANVGTDALNLVFALPFLLGTLWFVRRGSLIALLLWPGVLIYVLYIYIVYVVAVPFNGLFLAYVGLIALCVYTTIGIVVSIDGQAVREQFKDAVPVRLVGGVLAAFAILFGILSLSLVFAALNSTEPVDMLKIAPVVSDTTVEWPLLLMVGVLLWRRQALGYVGAAGMLLQIGSLFVGLPITMALGGLLTGTPIDTSLVMFGLFGVIPLALLTPFVRGLRS